MKKTLALCEGRHEMPECVEGSVFPSIIDPLDLSGMAAKVSEVLKGVTSLCLYVTGLSVALVEVIKYCQANNVGLTLYHFDKGSGSYYPQLVWQRQPTCPFCGAVAPGWYCPNCGAS